MQNIKEKVVAITSASSGLSEPTASLPKGQALCWVRAVAGSVWAWSQQMRSPTQELQWRRG
jgi:hypothetical protein